MKRVNYGGSIFLTTDAIAQELVLFAVDLANRSEAASVDVPGLAEDGTSSLFTLVLGPASQLVVDDITAGHELEARAAADDLREQRLRTNNPPPATGGFRTDLWSSQIDDL